MAVSLSLSLSLSRGGFFRILDRWLDLSLQFSIAECRPDMEKRAEWAALTSAAHCPITGRHPAIENDTYLKLIFIGYPLMWN